MYEDLNWESMKGSSIESGGSQMSAGERVEMNVGHLVLRRDGLPKIHVQNPTEFAKQRTDRLWFKESVLGGKCLEANFFI